MSDPYARAIAQARREPVPILAEALAVNASQRRTIEVLTERLAKYEALIRCANAVNEYADMAELTGAAERQAPSRTIRQWLWWMMGRTG